MKSALMFGAGRAGLAVARAMTDAGIEVRVVARSAAGAARVIERGLPLATEGWSAPLWILAVPDDAITDCARALLTTHGHALPAVALHLSGVASARALEPLAARGVETGSLHPLQTLTHRADAQVLRAVPAALGGTRAAVAAAHELAVALQMRPFTLPDEGRALYHAASAMAANFTVTLLDRAIATAERAGMPATLAREGLAGLAAAAAARVAQEGAEAALTGPIRRGDAGTVAQHLAALDASAPEDATLYRALTPATVALAARAT